MQPSSPVQASHNIPPARPFYSLLRYWMGRLISTTVHLPYNLYALVFKTEKVAQPIIEDSQETPDISPRNKGSNVPSPRKGTEEASSLAEDDDDFFESEEENFVESIVDSLYATMKLGENAQEALENASAIFDAQNQKQEDIDVTSLNGYYQIEWNITDKKDKSKATSVLLYKGHFEKGLFHGKGAVLTQELDGSLFTLLEGSFEHGKFESGMIANDNAYIDGFFINGEQRGKGIIHYLNVTDVAGRIFQQEYRGEFVNGKPHGHGKLWLLSADGIQQIGEGEFKQGVPLKGRFQEGNIIFNGEWKKETFTGTVTNLRERWEYEGKYVGEKFEGTGKLTHIESYEYDELDDHLLENPEDETPREEVTIVKTDGYVRCVSNGTFKQNAFYDGERKVEWQNGQMGTMFFEKGKVIKTEIITPIPPDSNTPRLKYVGQFTPYTLDGTGILYNYETGDELYSGALKCGFPHGQGCRKGTPTEEGFFAWGNFLGKEEDLEDKG